MWTLDTNPGVRDNVFLYVLQRSGTGPTTYNVRGCISDRPRTKWQIAIRAPPLSTPEGMPCFQGESLPVKFNEDVVGELSKSLRLGLYGAFNLKRKAS